MNNILDFFYESGRVRGITNLRIFSIWESFASEKSTLTSPILATSCSARVSGWNGPLLERKKGLGEQKEQLDVEDEMVEVH